MNSVLSSLHLESSYINDQLPMRIKVSPDFAQSMIKKMLHDLCIDIYMNDVGILSKYSFDNNMIIVDKVLEHLAQDEMKCNQLKCK